MEDKVVNHSVLLLKSAQGVGKTTFFENLMPNTLKDYFYSGTLNPAEKDTLVHLTETLIINLDELETLTKHKEGALKEIITKSEIRIRKAYGRFASKLTRHASMCGSVNHTAILSDPTGNRRFLIHDVESIDYQNMGNMDFVYGQAYSLYKSGFQYWFNLDDIKNIQAHNSQYEVQTVEEELLLEHYTQAEPKQEGAEKLNATQILRELYDDKLPNSPQVAVRRLGQALAKHGFNSVQNGGTKHWWIQPKNAAQSMFDSDSGAPKIKVITKRSP